MNDRWFNFHLAKHGRPMLSLNPNMVHGIQEHTENETYVLLQGGLMYLVEGSYDDVLAIVVETE